MSESEQLKGGSFVRWQAITINQFGFIVNLLLAFAVAALGLWVSLLRDSCFQPRCLAKAFFTCFAMCDAASILCGLLCCFNRLSDFRLTEEIAWDRDHGSTNDQLRDRRAKAKRLGGRTWLLFYFQIGLFTAAMVSLIAMLFLVYRAKLF